MHTNPEVLALLALGEDVGTTSEAQHALTCPVCSEEVAEMARIADVGRSSRASDALAAPSPDVWRRISAELGFDAPGDVLVAAPADRRPTSGDSASLNTASQDTASQDTAPVGKLRSGRGSGDSEAARVSGLRRFAALALAAALALVVGIGVGITYERRVTEPETRVIASAALKPLPQFQGASGTAEVTADGRGGRQLIVRMTSPKPINGTIAVWLMDSKGQATLMGPMVNGVARLPIERGMSLFERPTIDISDEGTDDPQPKQHNGSSILRGVLI
jgi:hypothetical protein